MIIRNPEYDEMEEILNKLNIEFVISKGKKLHIKNRYPGLYDSTNLKHLFLVFDNKKIKSFAAVKSASLISKIKSYNIFFIGSVYTDPQFRGKGYSSQLIKYIQEKYLSENYKLGILWTELHSFYQRLGWRLFENGIYVATNNADLKFNAWDASNNYDIFPFTKEYYSEIDQYRCSNSEHYISRKSDTTIMGYGTVYSPGEQCINYAARNANTLVGYLLGVRNENSLILYEIRGSIDVIRKIILKILHDYKLIKIKINLPNTKDSHILLDSLFHRYTINKPLITMYYFKEKRIFEEWNDYYIPFTDRI